MFEDLYEQYQKLSVGSKREKIIEEFKLVIAMLQLLCDSNNIKYEDIKIDDLENIKSESEYLDLVYTYITSLKEKLGSYVIKNEGNK